MLTTLLTEIAIWFFYVSEPYIEAALQDIEAALQDLEAVNR